MPGSVYFSVAQGQLFGFMSAMSRVDAARIQTDPFALTQLDGSTYALMNPDTTVALDVSHLAAAAYLFRLGETEAQLIRALDVEPDDLTRHENAEHPLIDFFADQDLAWKRLTEFAPIAIDDLAAIRLARQAADRKLSRWARVVAGDLQTPSIDDATEQLNKALADLSFEWLYRINVAQFAYTFVSDDPRKALRAYYDEGVRIERRDMVLREIEESLRILVGNDG